MKNRVIRILSTFFILVILASPALFGQTEKQLVPSDLKQQTIVTEPVTLPKGFLRLGFIANYRVADKNFNDERNKEYFPYNIWSSKSAFNLTLQYGINDRMEAGIVTEYMYDRLEGQTNRIVSGGASQTIQTKLKAIGFGDTRFDLKYQIIPEKNYKVSVTTLLSALLPTGEKNITDIKSEVEYDLPVGKGNYAASAELFGRTILYPYSFTAYLKYQYNFSGYKKMLPTDPGPKHYRYGNRFETGVSTNLHLNDWIVLSNDFICFYEGQGTINNIISETMPCSWSATYVPNLVFQVKKFRLSESVSIPLLGRNVPADPLFVMRLQYIF
jgi:hypothetical protein